MMPLLRRAFLPSLLLFASGCDNVGRAFDPSVDPGDPDPVTAESTVQDVPEGGDVRSGRPKVKATYPTGSGWPTTVPIVVTFNESVNEASILPTSVQANDARIILRAQGTTQALPCEYEFLVQGRMLVMRPVTALSETPTYEVVLFPDARDCDGVRFDVPEAGTVLAEFQANQAESFVDGRILALYPVDNARDFARESELVIVFDRPANVATLTDAHLQLQTAAGTVVPRTVAVPFSTLGVPDGRVVTIAPNATLAASSGFQLVVDDGVLFGAEGTLDFRGRTPFARFDTIAPQAPSRVQLHAPLTGFADKINLQNFATAQLEVDVPADALAGDKVRARIYGGNLATTGTGDRTFVERTTELTTSGAATVVVDFSGLLGTATKPKFDDGSLTFAAQLQRGSQTSGFLHQPDTAEPEFDVTLPTVQRVGPPGSTDGLDLWSDTESVAFYGVASERLSSASLTTTAGSATMVASSAAGRFVMTPLAIARADRAIAYTLTVTDRAGNLVAVPYAGTIRQRGIVTGTLAGTLTVEAYDEATLAPIADATVLVDNGEPTLPATAQSVPVLTDANGQASFNVTAPSHTITIVRAGYDLVTLYDTQAAFVSLPLRPATAATATWQGTAQFTPGAGVTAIVGNTAVASRGVLGVRTSNAAPSTIPDTALVPNRPQLITGFAGAFEPTANPPFSSHGAQFLGNDLLTPTPPGAPAAGGTTSHQNVRLLPSTGQITQLGVFTRDFGQATGLDLGSLVGGLPRVRMTASLRGFEGQALVGLGFATATSGTLYSVDSAYSTTIGAGVTAFSPLLWSVAEAQDGLGRISRSRVFVVPPSTILSGGGPFPLPLITAPSGPSTGSPLVDFVDGLDGPGAPQAVATIDVTATDSAGRRWVLYVVDRDGVGGTDDVQFPDLATANVQGLAAGDWSLVVEGRLWSTFFGGGVDDFQLTERIRTEVEYARSAAVTFTIQ